MTGQPQAATIPLQSTASDSSFTERTANFEAQIAGVQRLLRQAAARQTMMAPVDDDACTPQPLCFTVPRVSSGAAGDGVVISRLGNIACTEGTCAPTAVLCSMWMQSGRHAQAYSVTMQLGEVQHDTLVGVVGRNFSHPSNWDVPLNASRHAVAVRCGDGRVFRKGLATPFILRPLPTNGSKLRLTMDMAALTLTIEVLGNASTSGSHHAGAPAVRGGLVVEDVPTEITPAIGFAGSGPQRVRLLSCTCEPPVLPAAGMRKLRKDLWDEDNVQTLHGARFRHRDLHSHVARASALHAQLEEVSVSSWS